MKEKAQVQKVGENPSGAEQLYTPYVGAEKIVIR